MKISLNWLTDYVDLPMSAQALGDLFTSIGLNCDGIADNDADVVFDLDVTSNRPDWLGHLGVAREIAAATGKTFCPPQIPAMPLSGKAGDLTAVEVREPQLCPRYTARVIRGVKVGPSPKWLVERLAAVGMRSVNNVVDVTNFVLMEYSQPLHSFDYDKLAEHRIVVRRAKEGEMMVAIDGSKCALDPNMLVIADAAKAVAIAGVMGGQNTEVTGATVNILLESAQFDPLTTRRTSRKLGLMSDSNYRFERGVDPVGLDQASLRACQLIIQLAGGQLAEGMVDVWAKPVAPWPVALRPQRTTRVLGLEIPAVRQVELLERLGLSPRMDGERIVCTIPTFRGDLTREIDLIEEIARLEGYDRIPVGGTVTHAVAPEVQAQRTRREAGIVLSACGFDEAITPTFLDAGENELLGFNDPLAADPLVRRTNNVLRGTIVASLLHCCKINQDAGNAEVSLFELAKVFPSVPGKLLPGEHNELAMVTTRDLRDLRGALEALAAKISPALCIEVRPQDRTGFAPSQAGEVLLNGEIIGVIGVIAPNVQSHYGLERRVSAAAIDFDRLASHGGDVRVYQPLPRFPAMVRDLSLIVADSVTWQSIARCVEAVGQPMRTRLDYVTTYRGKPISDGQKSVTVTLTYRWSEGTLRSEQVDEQVEQVVEALRRNLGAEIRK